jgi:RNA methyltransferase, TrmH family
MGSRERERGKDADTERVFGLAAARAVLAARPGDVLSIAHTPEARREVAELLRVAAQERIAYREVERDELERMAGSLHHEGVCLRVKKRPQPSLDALVNSLAKGGLLLVLDGVTNPHNVGALLRSAAYFGARGMIVRGAGGALSSASVRVAQGGAEQLPLCFVAELDAAIAALSHAGVKIVAADAHAGASLDTFRWPERCALVLGAEREGLSRAVLAEKPTRVNIPGTGSVESLNVSVAAGVLLAAASRAARQRPAKKP